MYMGVGTLTFGETEHNHGWVCGFLGTPVILMVFLIFFISDLMSMFSFFWIVLSMFDNNRLSNVMEYPTEDLYTGPSCSLLEFSCCLDQDRNQ
jgi:hypothetical protein